MFNFSFEALQAFFQTNWGWAAGLAASMLALTALAELEIRIENLVRSLSDEDLEIAMKQIEALAGRRDRAR